MTATSTPTRVPARRPAHHPTRRVGADVDGKVDRHGTFLALVPPGLALLVASPAISSGLSGRLDPMTTVAVVAVALSLAWIASAAWVRAGRPQVARTSAAARSEAASSTTAPATEAASAAGVSLGRIEPVRVPAAEALPGTPPDTASEMEGPIA